MPIVRLDSDQKAALYLIGTEVKQLAVRGACCMVRVGGGYVSLEEYYDKYAVKQCVAFFQIIAHTHLTFVQTVCKLL